MSYITASLLPSSEVPRNIIYILQGSLWCKGISPGGFTGVFGPLTANAISEFQTAAGITVDKVVYPAFFQQIMNTDSYSSKVLKTYMTPIVMKSRWDLIKIMELLLINVPNGLWERKSHKNLPKQFR